MLIGVEVESLWYQSLMPARLAERGTLLRPQNFPPSGPLLQIHTGTSWCYFLNDIIKDKHIHVLQGIDSTLWTLSWLWQKAWFQTTFCKEREGPSPSSKAPFPLLQATGPISFLFSSCTYCLGHSNNIDQSAGTLSHLFMAYFPSWTIHLPQAGAEPLESLVPTTWPSKLRASTQYP